MTTPDFSVKVLGDEIAVRAPFKYNPLCRSIPGSAYCYQHKAHCYPAAPTTARLIADAFGGKFDGCTDKAFDCLVALARTADMPTRFEHEALARIPLTRMQPWPHQLQGYHMIRTQDATMLAFDMGTGKSKVVVDAVVNLGLNLTLIVCPKTVVQVWPAEFKKHAGKHVDVLALDKGSVADRAERVGRACAVNYETEPFVVVLNYESAWREPLRSLLFQQMWDLIVCDESHRIKSPSGKASRFMGMLRTHAFGAKRVCLTGTPMPHSPLDAYSQYRFLNPDIFGRSFVRFRAEHAVMGGFENHEVLGYRNMAELNRRFYLIAMRVEKADVLDLPDQVHETRTVQLGTEARRIYDSLERHFIAEVESGVVTAGNALAKLLRLQQVTSGFTKVEREGQEGQEKQIDVAKAEALSEVLDDLPLNEPVVVFCRFRNDLDQILGSTALHKREGFELSGRHNNLADWQADRTGSVLAAQIQAGSVGVDFTRAAYCVFYSVGFSLGDYEQALARLHRQGQIRSVTYIHLVAEGTVDEKVYSALSDKRAVVESVLTQIKENSGG